MPFDPKNENLRIWVREEKTDPAFTKAITGKAFKGTSINGTYAVKRLTQAFGPVGWGWGYHVVSFDDVHDPEAGSVNFCHLRFWYFPFGREASNLSSADPREIPGCAWFEQVGATELAGKRKSGSPFIDDEARKKSLTDALLKAASHIGIGGDIHLGLFDDNKYVAGLETESKETQKALNQAASASDYAALVAETRALVARLKAAQTMEEFTEARSAALILRPKLQHPDLKGSEGDLGLAVRDAGVRLGIGQPKAA
jgi:hypothetical protein